MNTRWMPPCSKCGKRIKFGNTNGLPNGVGFELEDGRMVNLCQECITKLGAMTEDEQKQFIDELKI